MKIGAITRPRFSQCRLSDTTMMVIIVPPERLKGARRFWLAIALQLCAECLGSGPAAAWGNVAHRAIVNLSEQQLTPETANEIRRLLGIEGATRMSDVVMWADQIRRLELPGTPDHDVGIPLEADGYDAARDCQTQCIVGAIPFYLAILADRSKPDKERLEALKYVAHLVGDIHQPLHASQDGGGQLVIWETKIVYLHILWDVTIVVGSYPNPDALAVAVGHKVKPMPRCDSPAQWANESHYIAKTFAFTKLDLTHPSPIPIPGDYATQALGMIEDRVALGVARLACVLNTALDPHS